MNQSLNNWMWVSTRENERANQTESLSLFFCCSLQRWSLPDCDWPDALTDPSVEMGPVFPPRLKRGQGSRHLGVDIPFSPDEEDTVYDNSHRNKYFSSSGDTLASVLSCTCVYFCILRPCSHLASFLTRKSWQERFFSKIKSWQRFGYK